MNLAWSRMDLKSLPFDTDTMLAGLKRWVECESPTYDPAAVSRMVALASDDMRRAGRQRRADRRPAGPGRLRPRRLPACQRAASPAS